MRVVGSPYPLVYGGPFPQLIEELADEGTLVTCTVRTALTFLGGKLMVLFLLLKIR